MKKESSTKLSAVEDEVSFNDNQNIVAPTNDLLNMALCKVLFTVTVTTFKCHVLLSVFFACFFILFKMVSFDSTLNYSTLCTLNYLILSIHYLLEQMKFAADLPYNIVSRRLSVAIRSCVVVLDRVEYRQN